MPSGEVAVQVRGLSKRYEIAHGSEVDTSLREAIVRRIRNPFRKPTIQEFWALRDVEFDIRRGDVVGIVGRNGAGKSTLLKILSRITEPTTGQIDIYGRVGSLLEVGTGFHPELTGRENVYLNGAILGMRRHEIARQFDEIVAFAEIDQFLDTPVKRYSSGMYVRLAFAVAAHLQSEILIVDEVLAVGDARFQKKCLGKIGDVSREGRTILFVSHNLAAVVSLCNRAVLLKKGRMERLGTAEEVAHAYQADRTATESDGADISTVPRRGTGRARFTSLEIVPHDDEGEQLQYPVVGCDLRFRVTVEARDDVADANVAILIFDTYGHRVVDINTAMRGEFLTLAKGESAEITFEARDVLLKPDEYDVSLWLGRASAEEMDYVELPRRLEMHVDAASSTHTEKFPGVYLCRFTHSIRTTSPQTIG